MNLIINLIMIQYYYKNNTIQLIMAKTIHKSN